MVAILQEEDLVVASEEADSVVEVPQVDGNYFFLMYMLMGTP